jgi:hypothetical protein
MQKTIVVIDSKKEFLDLVIPESKFPSLSRLLLIYQDGLEFSDYEALLDEYFLKLTPKSNENFTITIISPKLIQQEIHDLNFLTKLLKIIPYVTQFIFLLSSQLIKKETYELLDEIYSMGKILPTQLNFIYSSNLDEGFYYYFNHIDEFFRQGIEIDFKNKTGLVAKFQDFMNAIYSKLSNEDLTTFISIKKSTIQKEELNLNINSPARNSVIFRRRKLLTEGKIIELLNHKFQTILPKILSLKTINKMYYSSTFHYTYLPQFEGFTYPNYSGNSESIVYIYENVIGNPERYIDIERIKEINSNYSIVFRDENRPIFSISYYGDNDLPGDFKNIDYINLNLGLDHLYICVPVLKDLPQKKFFDELNL